jgi:hypothetical protein
MLQFGRVDGRGLAGLLEHAVRLRGGGQALEELGADLAVELADGPAGADGFGFVETAGREPPPVLSRQVTPQPPQQFFSADGPRTSLLLELDDPPPDLPIGRHDDAAGRTHDDAPGLVHQAGDARHQLSGGLSAGGDGRPRRVPRICRLSFLGRGTHPNLSNVPARSWCQRALTEAARRVVGDGRLRCEAGTASLPTTSRARGPK